jgi:hypothetical protein
VKVLLEDGWYVLIKATTILAQATDSDTMFQHINRNFPKGTQVE